MASHRPRRGRTGARLDVVRPLWGRFLPTIDCPQVPWPSVIPPAVIESWPPSGTGGHLRNLNQGKDLCKGSICHDERGAYRPFFAYQGCLSKCYICTTEIFSLDFWIKNCHFSLDFWIKLTVVCLDFWIKVVSLH